MTAPVSTRVATDGAGREMCFPVGAALQSNAPNPNDPLVYVHERPEMTVYTR